MNRSNCAGCRNNFYNGGGRECWSLKDAKVRTRFRIYNHVTPGSPGAFRKVRVPDCFFESGVTYYIKLPPGRKATS